MNILLLGKNGQVGWKLQRSLAPLGHVIALDREGLTPQQAAPTGAELIADVTAHCILHLLRTGEGQGTYHLAAAGETTWPVQAIPYQSSEIACPGCDSCKPRGLKSKIFIGGGITIWQNVGLFTGR